MIKTARDVSGDPMDVIWAGRHWARMTFSALTILGLAVYAPILMKFFQISPIAGSINLLGGLLQTVKTATNTAGGLWGRFCLSRADVT